LKKIEENSKDVMLVILSDVWLDRTDVLLKLEQLFSTAEKVVPTAFIFFGNFMSESGSADCIASTKLKGASCVLFLFCFVLFYPVFPLYSPSLPLQSVSIPCSTSFFISLPWPKTRGLSLFPVQMTQAQGPSFPAHPCPSPSRKSSSTSSLLQSSPPIPAASGSALKKSSSFVRTFCKSFRDTASSRQAARIPPIQRSTYGQSPLSLHPKILKLTLFQLLVY